MRRLAAFDRRARFGVLPQSETRGIAVGHMHHAVHEDAGRDNVVRVELAQFTDMLGLHDGQLRRRRHHRIEVARRRVEGEIAPAVRLPGLDQRDVAGQRFFEQVSEMVHAYLATRPDPGVFEFLRDDFATLDARHGGVVGTTFRTFPSFPQRYIERLAEQMPCEADGEGVRVEPLRIPSQPTRYTQDDLHIRQFTKDTSRRLMRKGQYRAA